MRRPGWLMFGSLAVALLVLEVVTGAPWWWWLGPVLLIVVAVLHVIEGDSRGSA